MLVVVRSVSVGPSFSALLELDAFGKVVQVRSPLGSRREQHFRERVDRFHEFAKPGARPTDVVGWLSRDNLYSSFQLVDGQDFESLYKSLSSLFVAGDGWGLPVREAIDVKAALAEPYHWRDGASAAELAKSWVGAGDLPASVRTVLETCLVYEGARFTSGHFEKQVSLPGRGFASHTDVMAYLTLADGSGAVVAVEGKVSEDIGDLVGDWSKGSQNRQLRLKGLCDLLGLPLDETQGLRYQLLHRTYSAVAEAQANLCREAVMLVHSFSPVPLVGFDAYS